MQLLFNIFLIVSTVLAVETPQPHLRKQVSGNKRGEKIIRERKTIAKKEYNLDADFDLGTSVNVNHNDVHDQLQLDSEPKPFNFIWIPISNLGYVVKVDTNTGAVLSAYRTSPSTHGLGDPSRTTVDQDGSVWVANRNDIYGGRGSIVHIGLLENNQCEDRDGTPGVRTSNSTAPLEWKNTGSPRGVGDAQDECIVHYTKVNSKGTRHLSIDANNDVWVSGFTGSPRPWDLIKGGRYDKPLSGTINRTEKGWNYGGYGGLMDKNGIIWSARPLLRWNPDPAPGTFLSTYSHDSYGLCIDSHGNVWNTPYIGSQVRKYNPNGTLIAQYNHGSDRAQGCVVDRNDDVWVAHSRYRRTVGHLKNNGMLVGKVTVGEGPTGVAVDGNGKIWTSNYGSGTLSRIDPDAGTIGGGGYHVGTVDLTVTLPANSHPYNYGDMTGSTLISPSNSGMWSIIYTGEFKWLRWSSIEPNGSSLMVEARNSSSGLWTQAQNGVDLFFDTSSEYLEVRVIFSRASSGESPILYDLTIGDANIPQEALCKNITVYLNNEGNVTVTATDINNRSNDTSGIASMEVSQSYFDCYDVGDNEVILNVKSNNGNSAQCTSTVEVVDNVTPHALCQDITIYLNDDGHANITATDINNGSDDACGIAKMEVSRSKFEASDAGTNQVILNITDSNDNSAQCTSTVTVVDNHPQPYIATPHQVHQYQQVTFVDESLWKCFFDEVSHCLACKNSLPQGPNSGNTGALIVDESAQYKGQSWNENSGRNRTHCIYPGYTWFTCGISGGGNMVIEPQTEWLSCFPNGDKPMNPGGPSGGSNPNSQNRADCPLDPRQGGCPKDPFK